MVTISAETRITTAFLRNWRQKSKRSFLSMLAFWYTQKGKRSMDWRNTNLLFGKTLTRMLCASCYTTPWRNGVMAQYLSESPPMLLYPEMRFSTNQRLDTQPNTINVEFQRFPSKTKYIGFRNSPSRHIVIIPYFHFLDNTSKRKAKRKAEFAWCSTLYRKINRCLIWQFRSN